MCVHPVRRAHSTLREAGAHLVVFAATPVLHQQLHLCQGESQPLHAWSAVSSPAFSVLWLGTNRDTATVVALWALLSLCGKSTIHLGEGHCEFNTAIIRHNLNKL